MVIALNQEDQYYQEMVIKSRNCLPKIQRRQEPRDDTAAACRKDLIVVGAPASLDPDLQASLTRDVDVIDLGAPRRARASVASRPPRQSHQPGLYTPNLRLYPGFSKKRERRGPVRSSANHPRKRKFTRPVPNSPFRLYRPAPAQSRPSPPPPTRPAPVWPAPLPPGALDTASHAALRLLRVRSLRHTTRSPPQRPKLRGVPGARPLGSATMAAGKYSTSPDCSDGNDASSAPSEFLAEFLSAIMRHQYAEALKYCQLILQYEPHNATAQGFYPLLRHKLHALHAHAKDETSSSEDSSSKRGGLFNINGQKTNDPTKTEKEEDDEDEEGCEVDMSQSSSGSGSGSGSLCSSLELDSSSPPSPRLARPPCPVPDDTTEPSDPTDPSDSSWRWESGGDGGDDNGNPVPALHLASGSAAVTATNARVADADNNTASEVPVAQAKMPSETETESPLRRLRAQFACSIK